MGLPVQSVKNITDAEIQSVYRIRYWALVKGDSLPAGVSYVVFDGAVNSGVSQSVKWLQRALGVPADGVIGPQTLNAARSHENYDALIDKICDLRLAFLKALKTWKTFGKGWARRVEGVRSVGQAWAVGSDGPALAYIPSGEAKARLTDAKTPPSKAPGDAAAGAGTVSTVITQATDQLTPLANIEFVGKAVAALTIAGVAVAVGGVAYRMWADRKAKQLAEALS
jgi:lysozyme family protein